MSAPVSSPLTRARRPRRYATRDRRGTSDGGVLARLTTEQQEVFIRALARIAWAAAEPASPPDTPSAGSARPLGAGDQLTTHDGPVSCPGKPDEAAEEDNRRDQLTTIADAF